MAALARPLTCSCVFLLMAVVGITQAQESSASPQELLNRPPADMPFVREQLLLHGESAVDPVVHALIAERDASPIRIVFLIAILQKLNTPRSQQGLIKLLSDERPIVRGYVAGSLGLIGARCAVPPLNRLLDDQAEYAQQVTTDPYREQPLTVASAAIKALEQLTGLDAGNRKDTSDVRRDFEAWWRQNRSRVPCEGL